MKAVIAFVLLSVFITFRTLAYSVGKTSFFVGDSPTTQVLTITNTFNNTLVIYNATLPTEAVEVFKVSNSSNLFAVSYWIVATVLLLGERWKYFLSQQDAISKCF